jgi:glutaredoxin
MSLGMWTGRGAKTAGVVKSDRSVRRLITFYTKPECPLCEEAKAVLSALRDELACEVREIDITADPALYEAFREEIPVGFLDGQKLFKYRLDPTLLRRQLLRRRGWFALSWRVGRGS